MRLIAKVIRILLAKFHCNRLTTVHDIQDHVSLIFGQCTVVNLPTKVKSFLVVVVDRNFRDLR